MNQLRIHFASLAFVCIASTSVGLMGCGSGGGGGGDNGKKDGGGAQNDGGGSGCNAGDVGCACDTTGSCGSGECVSGMCLDCTRGEADCACRANGSCDATLRCNGGVCGACAAGKEGCACGTGDSCDTGLSCVSDKCAKGSCTPGATDCPCLGDDPACDGSDYCDDNDMCRACTSDVAGCACETNGKCMGGLVCDIDKCRAAKSCDDLVEDGLCGEHQACNEGNDDDAECQAEECDSGYEWDDVTSECTKCKLANCAPEPTCTGGVPGSIKDLCASQSRLCVKDSSGAKCGGCIAGAVLVGDECVAQIQCGGVTCSNSQYCDRNDDTCKTLPCPTGQAKDITDACVSCGTLTCTGAGLTGRIWPFQTKLDDCICETQPQYFMPSGSTGGAIACDSDADGWVRSDADSNNIRNDDALKQNSRCSILSVDGVLLEDEYGQQLEVGSCSAVEGLVMKPTSGNCTVRTPMKLLEVPATDKPTANEKAKHVYGYPGLPGTDDDGRELLPRELNLLTKGCVSSDGDFNGTGAPNPEDLLEVQDATPSADGQARLLSFAYFMELQTSHYQAPSGADTYGKLVIRERSRCDLEDFPLRYTYKEAAPFSPGDEYVFSTGTQTGGVEPTDDQKSTYWRNCARFADPAAAGHISDPGFDFARFSPLKNEITPASAMFDYGTINQASDIIRNFGTCELASMGATVKPIDMKWRGMEHHSQFKCVHLVATGAVLDAAVDRVPEDFASNGRLKLNVCHANDCDPLDENCVESRRTADGSLSYEPVIKCRVDTAPTVSSGVAVGFAAVTYKPYGVVNQNGSPVTYGPGDYAGGCISEDVEWGQKLCPQPNYSMSAETSAFGRYSCWNELENFLWAATNADAGTGANMTRATLYWGPNSGVSNNYYGVSTVLR